MDFKQKPVEGTTPATTTKKLNKENQSLTWINFQVSLNTTTGLKKISSGIAADMLFKKLFGEGWEQEIASLSEDQLKNIASKIEFSDLTINIVTPSAPAKFEDLV